MTQFSRNNNKKQATNFSKVQAKVHTEVPLFTDFVEKQPWTDVNNRVQDGSHQGTVRLVKVVKANLHAMIGWPLSRPNLITKLEHKQSRPYF